MTLYHAWDKDKKHFTHEFKTVEEALEAGADILVASDMKRGVRGQAKLFLVLLGGNIRLELYVSRPLDQALSLFSSLLETHFALPKA